MKHENIPFTTHQDMISNSRVLEKYRAIIDEINNNFNHVEQVKKFELLPAEWSLDTGEMTPKMSVKRKVVMEKYKAQIEKIYS